MIAGTIIKLALAVASISIAFFFVHMLHERRALRRIARSLVPRGADDEEAARTLTQWVHAVVPKRERDPCFLSIPWIEPLGASPLQIVRGGGCCSGLARLLICLLREQGIEAAQLTLVHSSGEARHALVEARLAGRWRGLDPHYGFLYDDGRGDPVGLLDMRAGVQPTFRSPTGEPHAGYLDHPYYDFDYERSTTANWTRARLLRITFAVLDRLTQRRIRIMRQPWWAEWPHVAVIAGLASVAVVLSGMLLVR